jgi:hypothetical protein
MGFAEIMALIAKELPTLIQLADDAYKAAEAGSPEAQHAQTAKSLLSNAHAHVSTPPAPAQQ